METNNLFKKTLNTILNKEEIKFDAEIISAYELKNIIDYELEELYQLLKYKDELITSNVEQNKFINTLRNNKISKISNNIFNINLSSNKTVSKISFDIYKNNNKFIHITVKKEKNSNNILFKTNIDKKTTKRFISYNSQYISSTFDTMDYYTNKYDFIISNNWIESPNATLELKNDTYKVLMSLATFTYTFVKILPIINEHENNISYNISKNIENEVLKRIPINVNNLNPLYTKIFESSLEKQNIKAKKKVVSEN